MNVIYNQDQDNWLTMNMLKRSIADMKRLNKDGIYDVSIEKEEAILRSYFESIVRPEAEPIAA